jgi:uncharacterized protein YnzC (UPF0291/DUF896 family)
MSKQEIQQLPNIKKLPKSLINSQTVNLKIEQGVVIFRASAEMQNRIEDLLDKVKSDSLTKKEAEELEVFAEIDDYLSHVNRLIRNSYETSEVQLAA